MKYYSWSWYFFFFVTIFCNLLSRGGRGRGKKKRWIELNCSRLVFDRFCKHDGRGVIKRKGHTVYMHIYIYLTLIQSINESVDENGVRYFLFIFFFLLRLSVSMFASFICTMFKYLIGTIFNYGGREEYSCLVPRTHPARYFFLL